MMEVDPLRSKEDDGGGPTHDQEAQQLTLDRQGSGERLPITMGTTYEQLGDSSESWNRRVCRCLLATACILVAADVALRVVAFRPRSGRSSSVEQRWRPTVDILNASGIQVLKYVRDVGNYGLQGLALSPDGHLLYEFHTMGVRVLELDPSGSKVVGVEAHRVYDGSSDFPPISAENDVRVAHIGGVDLGYSQEHGSELWIATHSDGIDGEGALFAVDPDTLDVKASRAVRVSYNLDWVAFQDGVLYFGTFFNVKVVHRVSIATLEPLPDLRLSLPPGELSDGGINYVQSASFDLDGRLVLLGDDYQCTVYYVDAKSGALIGSEGLLLGSEVDGITYDRSRRSMLVGFNRQHSHEQVMHLDPMVSVIKLDLY